MLNEIERKLNDMDAGEFQKMCCELMYKCGKGNPTNNGGKSGSNKTTRGTPDVYILDKDGKYTFIEASTQKSSLKEKFISDLTKCIDEKKIGIKIKNIKQIIIMYNSILKPAEINEVKEICDKVKITFEYFDIHKIALLMKNEFPEIAKDYLNISVDTDQIITLEEFIKRNDKIKSTTKYEVDFFGRQEQIREAISSLNSIDSLILSGSAGVGKSRLAIEVCKKYKEINRDVIILCIKSNRQNIYEDLNRYIKKDNKYLFLIDDANEFTNVNLMLDKQLDTDIKLICTVRTYALNKLKNDFKNYDKPMLYNIDVLSNETIEEICKENFKILNNKFLRRIVKLSKGNARLCSMLSRIAVDTNSLESILDTTDILNEYYRKYENYIFQGDNFKTLTIISLLNNIHFDDNKLEDHLNLIKLDKTTFIECCDKLFESEYVDIYQNLTVKISDQILQAFILYKAFIEEKIIIFTDLIKYFFPRHKKLLIDIINKTIEYYPNQINYFEKQCKIKLIPKELSESLHEDILMTFYFANVDEVLIYINNILKQRKKHDLSDDNVTTLYMIIINFNNYREEVIDILLKAIRSDIKYDKINEIILKMFFNQSSMYFKFKYENEIFTLLLNKTNLSFESERKKLVNIINKILKNKYKAVDTVKYGAIEIMHYDTYDDSGLITLRAQALNYIKKLYINGYYNEVYKILNSYSLYENENNKKLYKKELKKINQILNMLKYENTIEYCLYVNLLNNISGVKKLKKYVNDLFCKFILNSVELLKYPNNSKLLNMLCEYLDSLDKKNKFAFIKSYNDYKISLRKYQVKNIIYRVYDFEEKVINYFLEKNDYIKFLNYILDENIEFDVNPSKLVQKMIGTFETNDLYERLKKIQHKFKFSYLYTFFILLPKEKVNSYFNNELINFLKNECDEFGYNRSILHFKKYYDFKERNLEIIIKTMLNNEKTISKNFSTISSENNIQDIIKLFEKNMDLLLNVYLKSIMFVRHFDYNCSLLMSISKFNFNLYTRVIKYVIKNNIYDFNFKEIWKLENYEKYVSSVFNIIESNLKDESFYLYSLEGILPQKIFNSDINYDRLINFIKTYIKEKNINLNMMRLIFRSIDEFNIDYKIQFYVIFTKYNKSFEAFYEVCYPSLSGFNRSWSGSLVPVIQKEIDFLVNVKNEISGIDYVEHRNCLQNIIEEKEIEIEQEKRNEFILN